MDPILHDLGNACRSLVRTPGFTAAALLTLALGIGANTAIFQLIDAVALRSLPVQSPNELVEVRIVGGDGGLGVNTGEYPQLTRPVWEELKGDQQALSGIVAWRTRELCIGERESLRPASGIAVSGEFFQVASMLTPLRIVWARNCWDSQASNRSVHRPSRRWPARQAARTSPSTRPGLAQPVGA